MKKKFIVDRKLQETILVLRKIIQQNGDCFDILCSGKKNHIDRNTFINLYPCYYCSFHNCKISDSSRDKVLSKAISDLKRIEMLYHFYENRIIQLKSKIKSCQTLIQKFKGN